MVRDAILWVMAVALVSVFLPTRVDGGEKKCLALRQPSGFRYPTLDDINQLAELARAPPDILKPLDQIEVQRPDEAYVKTGRPEHTGEKMTTFSARKKGGRWFIVPGSINTGEAIITS